MRIDKYLWCVRYYKTRTNATQACKKGAIRVNSSIVKPSREIYPGDTITVRKNQINYSLLVLDIPKSRLGTKLLDLFLKDTTSNKEYEKTELLKYSKDYYRKKGTGRPSKKDRRDLEGFTDTDSK